MTIDERQIRTTNGSGLVGYKAKYRGENVIAIMRGKECKECIGYIDPRDLQEQVNLGPYIYLDKII